MPPVVEVDRDVLEQGFAREPFPVKHNLVDHPLLQLDAIAELADRMPPDLPEHNLGDLPEIVADGNVARLDQSAGDIARGIETNGCWMVLQHVETDPLYNDLLETALEDIIDAVAHREGGALRKEGFIFLSAPNSVTPTHTDPEHNLLLQIRGSKDMIIGDWPDKESEQEEMERYYAGGHRNLASFPGESKTFHLEPSDGVYVPVHAPHVVQNGPDVSISFSITFYTDASQRMADVYVLNNHLKRARVPVRPPGERPRSDRIKSDIWRGVRGSRRAVGRLAQRRRS